MDENTIDRYATRTMLDALYFVEPKPNFFESTFFTGGTVQLTTETAEWDEVREGASMARYVHDELEVNPTEIEPFITKEISTPKIQEKRILNARQFKNRSAGENPYSGRGATDRAREQEDKAIAFCIESIDRRREQQCAQVIVEGKLDIIGKGVNNYVDFGLPGKQILSGTAAWTPSGNHMQDLANWARVLRQRGYNPDMLLMELSVVNMLMQDPNFKALLDNQRIIVGEIAPGPITDLFGSAQYFGTIHWPGLGQITIYTYDGTYKDENNKVVPYLDKGRVLLLTPESRQNRIFYGAETYIDEDGTIIDMDTPYFPEIYTDRRERNKTFIVTSRSMPVPQFSDSWWTVNVFGGA